MPDTSSSIVNKAGLSPGSLIHVGEVLNTTKITITSYNNESLEEIEANSISDILRSLKSNMLTWINIEGLENIELIEKIGSEFGIHQLVLEDILNTHQRPKFEEYDDHLFIVLKHLQADNKQFNLIQEQVSIIVFDNFVFTFKERSDDLYNPIRQRFQASKSRLRNLGTDYLSYVILDTIIDQYFVLIDCLDDTVTEIENQLMTTEPTQDTLSHIQRLKREIINIRRYISPTRDLMSGMLRSETSIIKEKTQIYLKDLSDHVLRVTEAIESYRDILSGLLDIYISSVSNRMNEVMKVLTVFASIFIPLTFLAGIYGMNFEYMPELKWKWAYPSLWIAFVTIPVALFIYFKKKKWL